MRLAFKGLQEDAPHGCVQQTQMPAAPIGPVVEVMEPRAWLAGLEAACGGKVVVHSAVRPEVYFAQVEEGNRAVTAAD